MFLPLLSKPICLKLSCVFFLLIKFKMQRHLDDIQNQTPLGFLVLIDYSNQLQAVKSCLPQQQQQQLESSTICHNFLDLFL